MGKWGTGTVERICQRCDKNFKARHDRLGLYCSRSCNSKRPQKNFKVNKICIICNKEYVVRRYRENITKCCSKDCLHIYIGKCVKGEKHPRWNNGISERSYSARKAILELKKVIKQCQKCGSECRLQGHHIIHYADRPDLTNVKDNILILCVNCHAKEHPKLANLILKGGVYGKEMDSKSNS